MWAAARVGKPKYAALRLALANLHRPGSPTPIVMLSLGLGLTVLVATALIEGNLREQITQAHPEGCAGLLLRRHPELADRRVREEPSPRCRGRASSRGAVAARPIKDRRRAGDPDKVPADARWAVDSDRGLTYSATQPEGSRLVAGQWWAPDYRGPQLVSFDAELARAFGIGVGDMITINVLGRDTRPGSPPCGGSNGRRCRSIRLRLLARPARQGAAHLPGDGQGDARGGGEDLQGRHRPLPKRHGGAYPRGAIQTASEVLGNIGLGGPADRAAQHPGAASWCWPAPCWRPSGGASTKPSS